MRSIIAATVVLTLAGIATSASASAAEEQTGTARTDAGLREFADAFDRAQLEKDGAALERMVADDLVFITAAGKREGKRGFIAGWTSPDERYDPVELTDRLVVPLGADAGQVTAEAVLSGTSQGMPFSSRFRFTDTFRRIDGRWQVVHIQVTRIGA